MRAKVVVRLLDEEGTLLGWASLLAEAPGDGTLRASPCSVMVERSGQLSVFSYHWTDMNVQTRVPFTPVWVDVGQMVRCEFPDNVVIRIPSDEGPLPPVTVRGSAVTVPVAQMGVV